MLNNQDAEFENSAEDRTNDLKKDIINEVRKYSLESQSGKIDFLNVK